MSLNSFTQTTFYGTQRQGAIWIHLPWPTVLSSAEAMRSSMLHLGANTKLLASGSCCLCVLLKQNAHVVHCRHICALTARHCPTPTGNGIVSPFLVLLLRKSVSLCIPGYPRFPCYPSCHQTPSNPPASALPSPSNSKYKLQYPASVSSFLLFNVALGAEDRT